MKHIPSYINFLKFLNSNFNILSIYEVNEDKLNKNGLVEIMESFDHFVNLRVSICVALLAPPHDFLHSLEGF